MLLSLQGKRRSLTWRCQRSEVVGPTVGDSISNLVEVFRARLQIRQHNRVQQWRSVVEGGGPSIASNCGIVDLVVHLQASNTNFHI